VARGNKATTFEGTTLGARCGEAAGDSEENVKPEACVGPEIARAKNQRDEADDKQAQKIPMSMEERMDGRQQGRKPGKALGDSHGQGGRVIDGSIKGEEGHGELPGRNEVHLVQNVEMRKATTA